MSLQTNGKMAVVSDYIAFSTTNLLCITGLFERRISFGYDADLAQVRADFDGLMLHIMVPRRTPPVTAARSTPAAVGRT